MHQIATLFQSMEKTYPKNEFVMVGWAFILADRILNTMDFGVWSMVSID